MSAALGATSAAVPGAAPRPSFPRAILFDFGGTLDADGLPAVAQFHRAYRVEGGALDADAFADPFRRSDHALAARPDIASLTYRATVAAQCAHLAGLLPAEPRLEWPVVAQRVVAAATATAARNRPVLAALRAQARLGVVSNFTGNVHHCLAELGLLDLVDTVADSAVVGHAKPDPAIFHVALDALGVTPADALMVGDNPFADVRAAAAIGARTCWITPPERALPPDCAPTYRIERLPDLLAALGADT